MGIFGIRSGHCLHGRVEVRGWGGGGNGAATRDVGMRAVGVGRGGMVIGGGGGGRR